MVGVLKNRESQSDEIVLGLLESVEQDGAKSQRRIAAELGFKTATTTRPGRSSDVRTLRSYHTSSRSKRAANAALNRAIQPEGGAAAARSSTPPSASAGGAW